MHIRFPNADLVTLVDGQCFLEGFTGVQTVSKCMLKRTDATQRVGFADTVSQPFVGCSRLAVSLAGFLKITQKTLGVALPAKRMRLAQCVVFGPVDFQGRIEGLAGIQGSPPLKLNIAHATLDMRHAERVVALPIEAESILIARLGVDDIPQGALDIAQAAQGMGLAELITEFPIEPHGLDEAGAGVLLVAETAIDFSQVFQDVRFAFFVLRLTVQLQGKPQGITRLGQLPFPLFQFSQLEQRGRLAPQVALLAVEDARLHIGLAGLAGVAKGLFGIRPGQLVASFRQQILGGVHLGHTSGIRGFRG